MSKRRAWIKFFTADFLVGITGMTRAQKGMYIELICLENEKGHLPEKLMHHVCGGYNQAVFDKFLIDEDGLYYTRRGEEELAEYVESRAKNAENGKKGGRPKKPAAFNSNPENNPVGFSEISQTKADEKPNGLFFENPNETERASDSLSLNNTNNNNKDKTNVCDVKRKDVGCTNGAREAPASASPAPKEPVKLRGKYGNVRLTDSALKLLIDKNGGGAVGRAIAAVDEYCQLHNKVYGDCGIAVQKAIDEKWGPKPKPKPSTNNGRPEYEFERNAEGKYRGM